MAELPAIVARRPRLQNEVLVSIILVVCYNQQQLEQRLQHPVQEMLSFMSTCSSSSSPSRGAGLTGGWARRARRCGEATGTPRPWLELDPRVAWRSSSGLRSPPHSDALRRASDPGAPSTRRAPHGCRTAGASAESHSVAHQLV
eukprot:Selendium_serpulae@DN10384_c0_g1_i1.p1